MIPDKCYANTLAIITTMITVMAVMLIMSMILIPVIVTTIIPAITMSFLITWDILAVVPVFMDKKDPLAAGVVLAAMLAPMFGVTRGDAQIDWRAVHLHPVFNNYRLTVDHLWLRKITDIKVAIETGLAYADRDANIVSKDRGSKGGSSNRSCNQKTFHVKPPIAMDL